MLSFLRKLGKPKLPESLTRRHDSKDCWNNTGSSDQVRENVLAKLCDAYVVDKRLRYKFRPDDTLGEIDRAFYPRGNSTMLELNCFVELVKDDCERSNGTGVVSEKLPDESE
ncbi:hypothetical protein Q31b_58030 [Novipirellula aureliae]|uniref:Uncharacterized protein n=1 Tax=Novipirellula aureliae TaxID=2527966 RepID=A0A5C6D6I1_9BACT|nr:hypothetical protein Q31b_58030 [Novipirellula aureliae]